MCLFVCLFVSVCVAAASCSLKGSRAHSSFAMSCAQVCCEMLGSFVASFEGFVESLATLGLDEDHAFACQHLKQQLSIMHAVAQRVAGHELPEHDGPGLHLHDGEGQDDDDDTSEDGTDEELYNPDVGSIDSTVASDAELDVFVRNLADHLHLYEPGIMLEDACAGVAASTGSLVRWGGGDVQHCEACLRLAFHIAKLPYEMSRCTASGYDGVLDSCPFT